jgi:hypothetical protein
MVKNVGSGAKRASPSYTYLARVLFLECVRVLCVCACAYARVCCMCARAATVLALCPACLGYKGSPKVLGAAADAQGVQRHVALAVGVTVRRQAQVQQRFGADGLLLVPLRRHAAGAAGARRCGRSALRAYDAAYDAVRARPRAAASP